MWPVSSKVLRSFAVMCSAGAVALLGATSAQATTIV